MTKPSSRVPVVKRNIVHALCGNQNVPQFENASPWGKRRTVIFAVPARLCQAVRPASLR